MRAGSRPRETLVASRQLVSHRPRYPVPRKPNAVHQSKDATEGVRQSPSVALHPDLDLDVDLDGIDNRVLGLSRGRLGRGSKSGPDHRAALIVTPLELLDRLAALVPPLRVHRHRYYSVLAPNAPQRQAVTAMAAAPSLPAPVPSPPPAEPAPRRAARYAWAQLLGRIYEALPLLCAFCKANMSIVAFLTAPTSVRAILARDRS